MNQEIQLHKKTGEVIDEIMASVQSEKIYTEQQVIIDKGDFFTYKNPLGVEEKLIVDDVYVPTGFNGEFHHLEIKYHKA